MRRLDEEELRVLRKIADRALEEVAGGRMVGIEDRDQLAMAVLERVVEIAGLGMLIARAGEIADAEVVADTPELGMAPLRALAEAASRILSEPRFCSVPPSSSNQIVTRSFG